MNTFLGTSVVLLTWYFIKTEEVSVNGEMRSGVPSWLIRLGVMVCLDINWPSMGGIAVKLLKQIDYCEQFLVYLRPNPNPSRHERHMLWDVHIESALIQDQIWISWLASDRQGAVISVMLVRKPRRKFNDPINRWMHLLSGGFGISFIAWTFLVGSQALIRHFVAWIIDLILVDCILSLLTHWKPLPIISVKSTMVQSTGANNIGRD